MSNSGVMGIVDVGCGNIGNVSNALEYLHIDHEIIQDSSRIADFGKIILPGVGSYPFFMKRLKDNGFLDVLSGLFKSGRSMLGICLGMQVFYEFSDEHNGHEGFGLVPGKVKRFDFKEMSRLHKVPHISWEKIKIKDETNELCKNLFDSIDPESKYYFLHSFYGKCTDPKNVIGSTQYSDIDFDSVITVNNAVGFQFHPELSSQSGLLLLANFSKLK